MNFPQAIRDVLIASMNKGQFPLALVGAIIIISIIKMPQNDVSKLVFSVIDLLVEGYMLGYLLFLSTVLLWFIHAKFQRRTFSSEIERMAEEKNRVQQQNLGRDLKSSRSKRR
jgi:hypothetical protein